MPSLNGKWIINLDLTHDGDTIVSNFGAGAPIDIEYEFYTGEDIWVSCSYMYVQGSAGTYYITYSNGGPGDEFNSYDSADNGWLCTDNPYGSVSRIINITDDGGYGEDQTFYNTFVNYFATKISDDCPIDMNQTKWLFNSSSLSNTRYTGEIDVYISGSFRYNYSKSCSEIVFQPYSTYIDQILYGSVSDLDLMYGTQSGSVTHLWLNDNARTLYILEYPEIRSISGSDSQAQKQAINDAITAMALINKNATLKPFGYEYKLGWKIVEPAVTYNTIYLKRFWNNGTAKYKLNNGNEVTLSTSNQELTLSNVTKLEVSIDCDDIGSILIDTSSFKSFGESANLFDQDYSHSGWVDVTQYLQEGCYVSLYPRD